jgi:hypothetical protein
MHANLGVPCIGWLMLSYIAEFIAMMDFSMFESERGGAAGVISSLSSDELASACRPFRPILFRYIDLHFYQIYVTSCA